MKRNKVIFSLVLLQLFIFTGTYAADNEPADYVDPFIGTGMFKGHTVWGTYPGTYPGAVVPFGMIRLSPNTGDVVHQADDRRRGYHYEDTRIQNFRIGAFSIMPVAGLIREGRANYSSGFSHEREAASPGYYSVVLEDNNIQVEFTADVHCGFGKLTFPETNEANILMYLDMKDLEIVDQNKIISRRGRLYFVLEFDRPFRSTGSFENGVFVNFYTSANEVILFKIGISATGIEGAEKNLQSEIPDWNFERVKSEARKSWNKKLKKIEVEGGTEEQKIIFYTALYHCLLNPADYTDVDGGYRMENKVLEKPEDYSYRGGIGGWFGFLGKEPLLTLLEPSIQRDRIKSTIDLYDMGWWPSESTMSGNNSIIVILDLYTKGITDFDLDKAYRAMRKSAMEPPYARDDISEYLEFGYVPVGNNYSVTKTLEYAYDDWALAQFAEISGNEEDYSELMKRALYYRNIFNPTDRFMMAKSKEGEWINKGGFEEGSKWTYSWFVPHNMKDLINLMGGNDEFIAKLETCFEEGHYYHDNEPPRFYPYLFNHAGAPWKGQKWVREIMKANYNTDPGGLSGEEDGGCLSSWYVFSAMGFYQVCAGRPLYEIGSPIFDKVTLHLDNGHDFIIEAQNVSEENMYIQAAALNREPLNQSWFEHSTLTAGGYLSLKMGPNPNKYWASSPDVLPPSITEVNPIFEIHEFNLSSEIVRVNEPFTITTFTTNSGAMGTKELKLFIDGEYAQSNWIMLDNGESVEDNISFRLYEPGKHEIRINTLEPKSIRVKKESSKSRTRVEYSDLYVAPLTRVGELVSIRAKVKNISSIETAFPVKLFVDAIVTEQESIALLPGETGEVDFSVRISELGMHDVTVGNLEPHKVKVYQDPPESIVLDLAFDEGDGKIAYDNSGFENNGILIGDVQWVDGKFSKAVNTGGYDYVEIPESPSLDIKCKTLTMMIWFYPMDEGKIRYEGKRSVDFFTKGDLNVLKLQDPVTLNFISGGWGKGECMAPVPENWNRNWHHVAGVCDGLTLKLYVDGELLQEYEISGNIGHTPFYWNIGRNEQCPKGRKTNGFLDGARIYHEALSQEEIRKAMIR